MADELLRSKHVFGSLVSLEAAIAAGKVDAYDILFLKDQNDVPVIGWLDKSGNPVFLEDETRECVVEVEALPESGEARKIYIFEEDGYFWDGTKFINLCKPTDVSELISSIKALEDMVTKNAAEAKAYTDEKAEKVLDHVKHVYDEIKYEFTDVPAGTLVDYHEDEIRIMCPSNAVFTKQSVGAGGDPNSYYGTLKTYAPNDAVGYIEHLGDQVDAEILTDLKTDAYGRKYQPSLLALAKYDESSDSWTYYGASSSKERYIGWNYQIDWYNADSIMISSDSIRINLSNEGCHFTNEPYYIQNATKGVEEKIEVASSENKAYTDERITEILNMFTIVEI